MNAKSLPGSGADEVDELSFAVTIIVAAAARPGWRGGRDNRMLASAMDFAASRCRHCRSRCNRTDTGVVNRPLKVAKVKVVSEPKRCTDRRCRRRKKCYRNRSQSRPGRRLPTRNTGKLDEVTYSGNGATELLRPVPASMVLDTCGVSSGGWLSNVTVAWAAMTAPVGSEGPAWTVYETKPSPARWCCRAAGSRCPDRAVPCRWPDRWW